MLADRQESLGKGRGEAPANCWRKKGSVRKGRREQALSERRWLFSCASLLGGRPSAGGEEGAPCGAPRSRPAFQEQIKVSSRRIWGRSVRGIPASSARGSEGKTDSRQRGRDVTAATGGTRYTAARPPCLPAGPESGGGGTGTVGHWRHELLRRRWRRRSRLLRLASQVSAREKVEALYAVKPPNFPLQTPAELPSAATTAEPSMQGAAPFGTLPPPYQLINLPVLETSSSQSDPPDYLLLINCRSTKLQSTRSHADSVKSTSSETDCNDNVPSHKHSAPPMSKHAVNGFFQQQSVYDSPPVRAGSLESNLYNLPRSYSQDASPKTTSPSEDAEGELYTFNVPAMSSMENQMRHCSLSYDIPPTPGGTYQIPRTFPEGTLSPSKLETILDVPPPRPPKPSHAPERSPAEIYTATRSSSETDNNYCIPTSGMPASRCNTISTGDLNRWRKDASSDDFYNIPRTFSNDRSSSLEGFNSSFKNRSMLTIGSMSSEDLGENYVPMNPNSPPRHHSSSLIEPIQETNYVPMTPGSFDISTFGMQVPPPVHMGFRPSPNTPQKRAVPVGDCEPPPVDRNLKPHRKGIPAPLVIKPLSEWEEMQMQTPIRSPVTRSFTRDSSRFPMPSRPASIHSTASSTDSLDSEESYVPMNPNLPVEEQNLLGSSSLDGGSSPMVKPKGDKQVEYLDLDLESAKSTPPRKKKSCGSGSSGADERVDYVVVDQQKTQALKSTREAWTDGRQSTETETPTKSLK
ncbi:GRB2-associated-binding protein 1 isoform X2 [Ambystoma mexicanum]|uniref:GRB2-associated-binding protein 1 isoform X2 n=1 Tax=Ambystoma mexicanum TaxID=8296 RepID=UPI0037E705B5